LNLEPEGYGLWKKKQDNGKIGKEPDATNLEDLPEYIHPFTHLFNKKKFEKLLV